MTEPLNLQEIAHAATDALAYSKVRSTRTQAAHVLALVALVRKILKHHRASKTFWARALDQRGRSNPTWAETCKGHLVELETEEQWWLGWVRDEEA